MRLADRGIEHHFSQAVESLVGPADIRERIKNAYLDFSPVLVDELDGELRAKYKALLDDLTKQDGAGGKVEATLRSLSDEQCNFLAVRILELYERLHELRTIDDFVADQAADLEG